MRLLLVNPYIYDFTAFDLWLRPLGLLYIAAVLKEYSDCEIYWVDVLDRFQETSKATIRQDGSGKFHREIVEKPPIFKSIPRHYSRYGIPWESFINQLDAIPPVDFVLATSSMTFWVDGVNATLGAIRARFPQAQILLGGISPSLVPARILKKWIPADYYLCGYGETQILEFLKQHGARILPYPDFRDLDNIPFPAVELLSNQNFITVITSRGCPYHCTYCASNILNPEFRERSPENILEEIHSRHQTFGTRNIIFYDDALLINKKKRFLPVIRHFQNSGIFKFYTPNGLHPREIDELTAGIMFSCGFQSPPLSFESTNQEILDRSSNKVNVQEMIQAVINLEAAGYQRGEIETYLLFGYPGQRFQDVTDALRFTGDLGVLPRLSFYSPVPGTPDYIDLQRRGVISLEPNLYETNKMYFVHQKSGFSFPQIQELKLLATRIAAKNQPDLNKKPE